MTDKDILTSVEVVFNEACANGVFKKVSVAAGAFQVLQAIQTKFAENEALKAELEGIKKERIISSS